MVHSATEFLGPWLDTRKVWSSGRLMVSKTWVSLGGARGCPTSSPPMNTDVQRRAPQPCTLSALHHHHPFDEYRGWLSLTSDRPISVPSGYRHLPHNLPNLSPPAPHTHTQSANPLDTRNLPSWYPLVAVPTWEDARASYFSKKRYHVVFRCIDRITILLSFRPRVSIQ